MLASISSPARYPSDLAWDGVYLWMAGYPSQKLYKVDPTDGTVVASYDVPSGTGQAQTAGLTYIDGALWLSTGRKLFQIDPANGQVVASKPNMIARPDGLAWDGQYLWIASFSMGMIYRLPMAMSYPDLEVALTRVPPGTVSTGTNVWFTAIATGTHPFHYAWTVDGVVLAGHNGRTLTYAFDAPGTYEVGVTVSNALTQSRATMAVEVVSTAARPDLSSSRKRVNLIHVEHGDMLTYTILVKNHSPVTATARLTDAIPAHTTYITGSAWASDGASVTLSEGALHWSGQVISGTPVLVAFAVEVGEMTLGTWITNVAHLDDGVGRVMPLKAGSIYNPGYRLSINDGALYTNIPTVTLRFSWNIADAITHIKISNDGGFGPVGGTTDWLPVDPDALIYPHWILATDDEVRTLYAPRAGRDVYQSRTVYALFRDAHGYQYGPIQDDISYDTVPPVITGLEILRHAESGAQRQGVIIRITASDDHSGVGKVQVSDNEVFETLSEFPIMGATTDIPWAVQPSGALYVRITDRAGNLSEVWATACKLYLPLVVK